MEGAQAWEAAFSNVMKPLRLEERLRQLPHWCGGCNEMPGVPEDPEWQDWTRQSTRSDQQRIEAELEKMISPSTTLLHVGVGNSSLAKKYLSLCDRIDGLTIDHPAKDYADSLGDDNYTVHLRSKYDPCLLSDFDSADSYTLIVDNNPTTFCCCHTHLAAMMANYYTLLATDGLILTDRYGLGWHSSPNDSRWGFSKEEWSLLGSALGLTTVNLTSWVLGLKK